MNYDAHFTVNGTFIFRSPQACHRHDMASIMARGNGDRDARKRLVRVMGDQFCEREFAEFIINWLDN